MSALLGILCTNGRVRPRVTQLLRARGEYIARQIACDLGWLVSKGLLHRVPGKLCYISTPFGCPLLCPG